MFCACRAVGGDRWKQKQKQKQRRRLLLLLLLSAGNGDGEYVGAQTADANPKSQGKDGLTAVRQSVACPSPGICGSG